MKRLDEIKMDGFENPTESKVKETMMIGLKDKNMNQIGEFKMTLSKHSNERINQRCISREAIEIAMIYGEEFFKQGLIFHVVGETNVPELVDPQLKKKCKNLVVVVAGDSGEIITSYRNKNPFRHIKKKSKRLRTMWNAA